MADALGDVLRLVAEGRLTAAEAEPIIDALAAASRPGKDDDGATSSAAGTGSRMLRIVVTERGQIVLNVRVPLALGRFAVARIPGLSDSTSERIRRAMELGLTGPIMETTDARGDGVRVVID